jgi:hypothetical protein
MSNHVMFHDTGTQTLHQMESFTAKSGECDEYLGFCVETQRTTGFRRSLKLRAPSRAETLVLS